jgi:hypothetical protein
MKKLVGLFALAAMSTFAAEITGFVGDASCGAKHADASEASAKCAQTCVSKKGAAPVLVTKDAKVYKLDADSQAKVKDMVGKTVTVNGKISGDTLTIVSVQ